MKRLLIPLIAAILVIVIGACGTTPTTNPDGTSVSVIQKAIDTTTTSYQALDFAIVQGIAAIKAGQLKGQDARNALQGFTQAKAGLDLALGTLQAAQAAASAASGAKP